VSDERQLVRVRRYLTERRGLANSVLEGLIESGKLYADRRGNAVFLLVAGKPQRPVGAELRGTGPHVWRGIASGTCKNSGFFWLGAPASRQLVLCEAAIDAISYYQMNPDCLCLSTSGVRANPAWLPALITRGYEIHCGFDADKPGDDSGGSGCDTWYGSFCDGLQTESLDVMQRHWTGVWPANRARPFKGCGSTDSPSRVPFT